MVRGSSGRMAGLNIPWGPINGTRVPAKSKPRSRMACGIEDSPKRLRCSLRNSKAPTQTVASTSSATEAMPIVPLEEGQIWSGVRALR